MFNIDPDDNSNRKTTIKKNTEDIVKTKALCEKKIKVFNECLENIDSISETETESSKLNVLNHFSAKFNDLKDFFEEEVNLINNAYYDLGKFQKKVEKIDDILYKKRAEEFNQLYGKIYKSILDKLLDAEQTYYEYLDKIVNNRYYSEEFLHTNFFIETSRVLLISEIQDKVVLPYDLKSVQDIITDKTKEYSSMEEIVEQNFTLPLSRFKNASMSRFREAYALMKEREKASFLDALQLALEVRGCKYIHPAIIAACRNADQLDVYIDCLESNELDDYPFFKIKYELYPIRQKDGVFSIENVFKGVNFFRKKFKQKEKEVEK